MQRWSLWKAFHKRKDRLARMVARNFGDPKAQPILTITDTQLVPRAHRFVSPSRPSAASQRRWELLSEGRWLEVSFLLSPSSFSQLPCSE
jgi:hypothetical protein